VQRRLFSLTLWVPWFVLGAQGPVRIAAFGGADSGPEAELVDARHVVRADDGRFIVANGKPLEVRVYTATGRLQRILGRVGGGPGEYQGSVRLRALGGDSVAMFSTSGRRWMVYRLDGRLVREWTVPSHPGPESTVLLRGRTVLRTGIEGSRGCAVALLGRVPASLTTPHDAMSDAWGRLWIRELPRSRWTVIDRQGRVAGAVELPKGLWVTQFRGDTVVGLEVDVDGFTQVRAIATRVGPGTTPAGADCAEPEIPVTPVRSAQLRTALRNMLTFGESRRASTGRYPVSADELPDGIAAPGSETLILATSRDSWVVAVRDDDSGYHCLMSLGPDGLPGILDGVMRCGW
jgi:hypothetical protein